MQRAYGQWQAFVFHPSDFSTDSKLIETKKTIRCVFIPVLCFSLLVSVFIHDSITTSTLQIQRGVHTTYGFIFNVRQIVSDVLTEIVASINLFFSSSPFPLILVCFTHTSSNYPLLVISYSSTADDPSPTRP